MANIKYIFKDQSFRFFLIGLAIFFLLTSGGLLVIKHVISQKQVDNHELVANENNEAIVVESAEEELIIDNSVNNEKSEQSEVAINNQLNQDTKAPIEISKTGNDYGLTYAIVAAAIGYIVTAVFFVPKSNKNA